MRRAKVAPLWRERRFDAECRLSASSRREAISADAARL